MMAAHLNPMHKTGQPAVPGPGYNPSSSGLTLYHDFCLENNAQSSSTSVIKNFYFFFITYAFPFFH